MKHVCHLWWLGHDVPSHLTQAEENYLLIFLPNQMDFLANFRGSHVHLSHALSVRVTSMVGMQVEVEHCHGWIIPVRCYETADELNGWGL